MAYGTVVADVVQSSITGVSLGAGNATLLKNRLIDAGFIINQRGYVSGTALSAGTYAHDRWKAGASGCTYTFTQGSLGVPIVITITAGSLQQIIEGCNMPDGGTFTLSWTGTAQGRVNGGGYSTSPLIVTGLTAGANCTVEFNTGTCSFPQLEVGTSATGFEYVNYQTSLANCQRYFQISNSFISVGYNSGSGINIQFSYPTTMRASATVGQTGVLAITDAVVADYTQSSTNIALNGGRISVNGAQISCTNFSGLTNYRPYFSKMDSGGSITFSAEL